MPSKRKIFFLLSLIVSTSAFSLEKKDVDFLDKKNKFTEGCQRCQLDLYLPKRATKSFPTLVWFHGGGLKRGDKSKNITVDFAESLQKVGVAVAAVNYRLYPDDPYPSFMYDGAAATRWVMDTISSYGGDPQRIYIGGHSAGGYIALMLAMDEHYLKTAGLGLADIAGFIPVSGQTVTHSTLRQVRGYAANQIVVDRDAPLFYVRKFEAPMMLVAADNDSPNRLQENQLFYSALKNQKSENVSLLVVKDRRHNSIITSATNKKDPLIKGILDFVGGQ